MNNAFSENISNEDLAVLPAGVFTGGIAVVDTQESLMTACDYLLTQDMLGFDTETRPSFKAGNVNKVALVQLSTADRCFLFRLCRTRLDKALIKILENKHIVKVGADVGNDLRAMQQLRRFRPDGFTDLQSIVAQWGIADKSVRKMAGIILGVRISKAQRLSNWEASELTPAQQAYAATDAWSCLEMYRRLMATDKK